ncbi:MAG: hypothetical protein M0C28_27090 [Candidatus Moduliflexus flocculans]|nr:hypothetical protein [Candidatus Moduliflexus flocculans]
MPEFRRRGEDDVRTEPDGLFDREVLGLVRDDGELRTLPGRQAGRDDRGASRSNRCPPACPRPRGRR